MLLTLDKSLPIGTVSPLWHGAAFRQMRTINGNVEAVYFNAHEVEVWRETDDDETKARLGEERVALTPDDLMPSEDDDDENDDNTDDGGKPGAAPSAPAAPKPTAKPVRRGRPPKTKTDKEPETGGPTGDDSGVDLTAWAEGREDHLFGDVSAAINKRFNRIVTNREDAVEFLIENGVVTADRAK